MLRPSRQNTARAVRLLHGYRSAFPPEATAPRATAVRPLTSSSTLRLRTVLPAPSKPHAAYLTRWPKAGSRRREGTGVLGRHPVMSATQLRGLASSGKSGGKQKEPKGSEDAEGVFEKLKQTFQDELDKNPSVKENISKMKKEAERKMGGDAKDKMRTLQNEASKYASSASEKAQKAASSASEKAQKAGGVFQEKMEGATKVLKDNLGKVTGARAGAGSEGEGKGDESENEFVRASKEKFSGAQKALDENSVFAKMKATLQELREQFTSASAELVGAKEKEDNSAVVKKLKQPKKKKKSKKNKTAGNEEKGEVDKDAKDSDKGKRKGADAGVKDQDGMENQEDEEEEDKQKEGVGGLMIVKSAGEAWKRLQERLREAPIIQELLGASRVVAGSSLGRGAKAATDSVKDKVEDVSEAWETSQHPLVYKVSSAWDSMTAESELGVGVKELRRLDPSFTLEDWKSGIQEDFLPDFMSAFLRGDAARLEPWTGEACFNKLSSEIRQRKADGIVLDPHVLDVRQGEVVTIKADAGKANPTVAFQFMCQQINCVRNTKGEVIEGSEDDIRATYYMLAFQREFMEDDAELRWKVVDMMVIGAFPWY